ncbi:hypothetical protein BGZ96_009470 [Linnemannia gamsii]|uniref:Uncharacterized protein n=1 Tax=Linnemannia gamsii TaxID=64522 RepID=A0ABQ7JX19_9FUNG|nr:hypothetical protein BGZ96_009470 [Linnemannia gamsii]
MSDSFDDWEQANDVEIEAPVVAPAPIKKKIAILSRPTSTPGSPVPTGPILGGSAGMPGSPVGGMGRIGGGGGGSGGGSGGGVPMILKRNPGSNSSASGGGASQHGSSPSGQRSPATFSRESSPFGDNYSNSSNSGRRSGGMGMGTGYLEDDPDLVGENTLRRQMDADHRKSRHDTDRICPRDPNPKKTKKSRASSESQ